MIIFPKREVETVKKKNSTQNVIGYIVYRFKRIVTSQDVFYYNIRETDTIEEAVSIYVTASSKFRYKSRANISSPLDLDLDLAIAMLRNRSPVVVGKRLLFAG